MSGHVIFQDTNENNYRPPRPQEGPQNYCEALDEAKVSMLALVISSKVFCKCERRAGISTLFWSAGGRVSPASSFCELHSFIEVDF